MYIVNIGIEIPANDLWQCDTIALILKQCLSEILMIHGPVWPGPPLMLLFKTVAKVSLSQLAARISAAP